MSLERGKLPTKNVFVEGFFLAILKAMWGLACVGLGGDAGFHGSLRHEKNQLHNKLSC